ncbi:gustatory receptor for sugar taste 64a-like [Teleopsis dalmanni]|uniref:gustatory receptor for sugar taste 64a-like n=1 Tax=Teleopsis dalmanni TaxID=139649 RepID=UPI0018CEB74C|nr:gustatory receptor for sugar taste 64a-like [Teleopsis dalmanni]
MVSRNKLRKIFSKHQPIFGDNTIFKVRNNIYNLNKVHAATTKTIDNNSKDPLETTTTIAEYSISQEKYISNDNINAIEQKDDVSDIFHRAVYPIIIIAQCFGVMPVMGVRHKNPRRMQFSFISMQLLVTLIYFGTTILLLVFMVRHLWFVGIDAKNIGGVIFYISAFLAYVLFMLLAARWPKLIRVWARSEITFNQKPYEILPKNLAARIRTAATIIIILSAVEHGLSVASNVLNYTRKIEICAAALNTSAKSSFDDFIKQHYVFIYSMIPYNIYGGAYIMLIHGACTFVWNYMDLFIVMISKGIAYRFEQITTRINKLAGKEIPEDTFAEIREHYVKVCELLDYVDDNLSGIILLSCANNLYFVCNQLLNVFNKLRWPINYIYFWYSLLYLIGRTAYVFLTAASINDESKAALGVLRRVSKTTWCVEVERLIFQMATQTVALSGKKFYYLTRKLLFGILIPQIPFTEKVNEVMEKILELQRASSHDFEDQ